MAAARRKRHEEHEEHVNHERWLITYADMITLLMVLFIVLYSISQVDLAKFRRLKEGLAGGFGGPAATSILEGGSGALDGSEGILEAALADPKVLEMAGAALESKLLREHAERQERDVLQRAQAEIEEQLAADGLSEAVQFRLEARGLVVTIVTDQVLFAPGEADLRPEGFSVLDHLGPALAGLAHKVSVEGHTDNVPISGRYPSNWELSTARATTVLRQLIDRYGLPSASLSAAGYADQRPVAGNDTAEGRTANRRVEIVVHAQPAEIAGPPEMNTEQPVGEA